jgi:hypothetical protein
MRRKWGQALLWTALTVFCSGLLLGPGAAAAAPCRRRGRC